MAFYKNFLTYLDLFANHLINIFYKKSHKNSQLFNQVKHILNNKNTFIKNKTLSFNTFQNKQTVDKLKKE